MKYLLAALVLTGCGAVEETLPRQPETRLEYVGTRAFVFKDPETKCEYLVFQNGGASPRMDGEKQICD
jgi:hypothetical protein